MISKMFNNIKYNHHNEYIMFGILHQRKTEFYGEPIFPVENIFFLKFQWPLAIY